METSSDKDDCRERAPVAAEASDQSAEDWTYLGFFDCVFRWYGLAWIVVGCIAGATVAVV